MIDDDLPVLVTTFSPAFNIYHEYIMALNGQKQM